MYFITFSEKMGTNGAEIARRVADRMGYAFYDTEAIENAAQEMGFLEDVKEIDQRTPSLFERIFSRKPEIYLERLISVIYELASRGNAVFLGRGGYILLRQFKCAFHVMVTGSREKRILNLMERGFPREVAVKEIQRSDQERESFVKFAFGVDWGNPDLFDIVLNTDNLSADLAAEIVSHAAGSEEIKARSLDVMKSLEIMALTRRIEAALIEAHLSITSFSVAVLEPGKIRITGYVGSQATRARAERVLQGIKGITAIDNEIEVMDAYRYPA